ncbi:MAG: thioesterase family protein [Actinobacteria bacterium]|nr:thioesterase family protein [Actinomycetota bacterium]
MKHQFKCQVRWGDLDAFMHVNNAAYLTYIQEARVDFTVYARQRANLQPVLIEMVVAHADIDYINPIYDAGIEIDIAVWVSKIGTSSFVLQYELSKDGKIYAKAKTVQVTVSMESKSSRPVNEQEREFLSQYLISE